MFVTVNQKNRFESYFELKEGQLACVADTM